MPSWKDPKHPTYGMCECEHISHSDNTSHDYEAVKGTKELLTTFGPYWVCNNCAKNHLKDYIIE